MATLPFPQAPAMPAVARILARFDRQSLSGFIAVALDLLDTLDGDADSEEAGDDNDTTGDEADASVTEWHHRHWRERRAGKEPRPTLEDDEDDDADSGADDEGEAVNEDGDHDMLSVLPIYGVDQSRGPVNEYAANGKQSAAKLGLVRSPSGGWRLPN